MNELIAIVLLFVVFFFVGIGGYHVLTDQREFPEVIKQCKEQGFIQDKKTRILCQVEGAK